MTDGGASQTGATAPRNASEQFAAMDAAADEDFSDDDPDEHALPCEKNKLYVRVILRDDDGMPYTGVAYTLVVGEETIKGRTGADGMVEQLVPKTATTATLTAWTEGDDEDESPTEWTLALDAIDPLAMETGRTARLLNFGFVETDETGKEITPMAAALADFGFWMGLLPTQLEAQATDKLGGFYRPSATALPMMPADDPDSDDESE